MRSHGLTGSFPPPINMTLEEYDFKDVLYDRLLAGNIYTQRKYRHSKSNSDQSLSIYLS